jgi:hypothetical protein
LRPGKKQVNFWATAPEDKRKERVEEKKQDQAVNSDSIGQELVKDWDKAIKGLYVHAQEVEGVVEGNPLRYRLIRKARKRVGQALALSK